MCMYRRILQLRPPPLCMLALGKTEEEASSRDSDILHVITINGRRIPRGRVICALWQFDGQNSTIATK